MIGERSARFGHLHQAQHSFVHAGAAGSRDDDNGRALGRAVFDHTGDSFADNGAHCRRQETEIHHRDCDFVPVDHAVPANYCVNQTRRLLIFLQAVFVSRHSLETKRVDRRQAGIHFHKTPGVEQVLDSVLGREREVIFASRTNTKVLVELDFVNDFIAAGALLKETVRNVAFLATLRLK